MSRQQSGGSDQERRWDVHVHHDERDIGEVPDGPVVENGSGEQEHAVAEDVQETCEVLQPSVGAAAISRSLSGEFLPGLLLPAVRSVRRCSGVSCIFGRIRGEREGNLHDRVLLASDHPPASEFEEDLTGVDSETFACSAGVGGEA